MKWRPTLRRVALGILIPSAVLLLGGAFLLGRLAHGPLDITGMSHRWGERFTHVAGGRVTWGHVALAWRPQQQDHPSEVRLYLDNVQFQPGEGLRTAPAQQVAHMEVVFHLAALLRGETIIQALHVTGLALSLEKDLQGQMRFAGMATAPLHTALPHRSFLSRLEAAILPSVLSFHETHIQLVDAAQPDKSFSLSIPELMAVYQAETGWQGHVTMSLSEVSGLLPQRGMDAPSAAALYGEISPAKDAIRHWYIGASHLQPALIAAWLPLSVQQSGPWRGSTLPVSFQLNGDIYGRDGAEGIGRLSGQIEADAGEVVLPKGDILHFASARASLTGGRADEQSEKAHGPFIGKLQAQLMAQDARGVNVPILLGGHIQLDDISMAHHIALGIEGTVPHFDFATLASIWPQEVARGARRWMTTNMTSGTGEGLHILAHMQSDTGWDALAMDKIEGDLLGHNLSVTWLRDLPQVTGIEAHAHFLDADRLQIDVQHGRLAPSTAHIVTIPEGRIILSGLMKQRQMGDFSLTMDGALPSFLEVLSEPKLNLLSRHPVVFHASSGTLHGVLSLSLPLEMRVKMKEIAFGAELEAQRVGLTLPSLGRIDAGQGHVSVQDNGMTITGGAHLWGLALKGTFFNSFQENSAGRILMKAVLDAPLTAANLRALGAPPSMAKEPALTGRGQAHLTYTQLGQGRGHIQGMASVQMDFTPMAFRASFWQKQAGVAAGLKARLIWQDGRLERVEDLSAYGPLLTVTAQAHMRHGDVGGLVFSRIQVGRTEGRALLDWPLKREGAEGRYRFDLQATTLDITPWWGKAASQNAPSGRHISDATPIEQRGYKPLLPTGRWAVNVTAGKLIYGDEQVVQSVTARAAWEAERLKEAHIHIEHPYHVGVDITPRKTKEGVLDVKIEAENTGALLASLGLYKQLDGGVLSLQGVCQPVAGASPLGRQMMGIGLGLPPFRGAVRINHLALNHPPAPLVMATLAAPLHWGSLSRERFEDIRLRASFAMSGGVLDVEEGRASNAILGGTLKGQVNFVQSKVAMRGTLSPFFRLNHAAATMFGEDTFMAPEKGSGIMAMTYTLEGHFAKLDLHVNPFSALLPGALRNLF